MIVAIISTMIVTCPIAYVLGYRTKQHVIANFSPSEIVLPHQEQSHKYRVERKLGKREWILYSGSDGAEALKWIESVKHLQEPGTMEFFDNDVLRDFYEGS